MATAAATAQDTALAEQLTVFVDAVAKGCGISRTTALAALNRNAAKIAAQVRLHLKRDGSATDRRLSQVRADLDRISSRLLGTSAPEIQLTRDESNSIRLLTGQHLGGRKLSAAQARELVLKRTRGAK